MDEYVARDRPKSLRNRIATVLQALSQTAIDARRDARTAYVYGFIFFGINFELKRFYDLVIACRVYVGWI